MEAASAHANMSVYVCTRRSAAYKTLNIWFRVSTLTLKEEFLAVTVLLDFSPYLEWNKGLQISVWNRLMHASHNGSYEA